MSLKIVCSGHLVRYPLGGHSWHHLQYLIGFQRLGHDVTFFEDYGWSDSCFDPALNIMSADPGYGIKYVMRLLEPYDLQNRWCYLAEDGTAHGLTRKRLAQACREADIYFNLSNINWIPELEECRRRVLIDTDPVFTQIGAHGMGGPFSRYDALFTYGENVHRPGCEMPTAGAQWLATRQPIVLDLWPVKKGNPGAPFTTIMNWSPLGDCNYEGRLYGQKEREFEPFFSLPRDTGASMQVAVKVPTDVCCRLVAGGWSTADPVHITRSPFSYQTYLRSSKAEFSVAKHGYVATRCGWFSERSAAYLASGRPVVIQDTGFSHCLSAGHGLVPFNSRDEAAAGLEEVNRRYAVHCRAAREVAEQYFEARKVLTSLLDRALGRPLSPPSSTAKEVAAQHLVQPPRPRHARRHELTRSMAKRIPSGETPYTTDFYEKHVSESQRSAEEIVPLVLELLQPRSVVDVGCGVGTWLSVFREHGIEEICGIDGPWVDRAMLKIPQKQFSALDLEKPFRIGRQFDLVLSVEVAEHLPQQCAKSFVHSLVSLAPAVLFSAAIPFQGGANHVNEQWPDYWARYFAEEGYAVIDCLRKKIWRNDKVEWWYAQNLLVFARRDYLEGRPVLKKEYEATAAAPLSLVHPKKYLELIESIESVSLMTQEIAALTSPGELFILVDEGRSGNLLAGGRRPVPFTERNGEYWGPPADDASAIHEVERQRARGAHFMIFTQQAFWWLDYYSELHGYLRSHFRCRLENERLVVFDLAA